MKKFLIAWIGSFIVMFILAGIFNGVIIRDYVDANFPLTVMRAGPDMAFVSAGYLLLAFLMTWIYPRVVASSSNPVRSGAIFGMVAGICWLLPFNLVMHGVFVFPALALLIEPAWALLEQGLGGVVIGLVYARLS